MLKGILLLFLFVLNFSCSKPVNKKIIAIQPLGIVSPEIIRSIQESVELFYGSQVIINSAIPVPDDFFVNYKSPRYCADSIIHYLKVTKPDSVDHILAVTGYDISTSIKDSFGNIKEPKGKYRDWGIFGLGYRPGSSCIVSTFRLKHKDRKIFLERMNKVSLHELGHNFNLPHCTNNDCFMQDAAESIKTIDKVSLQLCGSCVRKIL
ncbi:MAG: hypothetical protein ACK4ND_09085 [Cytophagaceae bacterium]